MDFTRFMELPAETKMQIIDKCCPFSYVRLRRVCRFVDEFCEHNRKWLRVYCPYYWFRINLWPGRTKSNIALRARWGVKPVTIFLTPDNMVKLNKALSGFLFATLQLYCDGKPKYYTDALNYFLEAVPDLKVKFLSLRAFKFHQVERVMSSKWKIGGVSINCQLEMCKILKIERIRQMDPLYCIWSNKEKSFTEQDIVQLARGKKHMQLSPGFLSMLSCLNVLKTIVQNWKIDGHFPKWFRMSWNYDERSYMSVNMSGLYSEIMDMETCYLGSFFRYKIRVPEIKDIWIRKDETKWQLVTIKRSDYNYTIGPAFTLKTPGSTTSFVQKITKILYETFCGIIIDKSSLYEACQTENMEQIKEAFVNMIPRQQQPSFVNMIPRQQLHLS